MSPSFLSQVAAFATATISATDQFLTTQDRFIFWIGGTLALLATLFLVIGSIRFKDLRKQPGDLIVGIALSDMALAIHWLTLATWYEHVTIPEFCHTVGALGVFAASSEYFYNIAFNFFLITSLRNALKQARIPQKTFHMVTLSLSAIFLIVLFHQGKIGRTAVGTCSIIPSDNQGGFAKNLASVIVGSYAFVGLFTLYYIRKNAPKCAQSHSKRTHFILYYSRYIIASIIIYSSIAVTNFLTVQFNLAWVNSLYNIVKLCGPIVLSFIRYNDPLIKKIMIRTIFFWKKPVPSQSIQDPLIIHAYDTHSKSVASENEFVFNALSAERRVEIIYTLLSCVLYSDYIERNQARISSNIIDMKENNPYKHQRLHQIGDNAIRYLFPEIKDELDRVKYSVLPGTLKVYAPEVFSQLLEDDKLYLNIQESLNFHRNKDQIKDASGPGGGKSGEFFFFSSDKKLIIKTIPDVEMKQISRILERYQEHMRRYPNSLIAKIYGAYTFQSTDYDQTFNLIIMKNISGFSSSFVESIYDMKGSTYDREVLRNLSEAADGLKKGVLKDLDFEKFEKKLHIRQDIRTDLINQIEMDALFFRSVKLIDYSFMVFCINKRKYIHETRAVPEDGFVTKNPLASLEKLDMMGNGTGMFYHMGIVDYLQPYNFSKFMEKWIKKVKKFDTNLDTSSQNPQVYSARFIRFIKKIAQ